jgi:hypothetical protein
MYHESEGPSLGETREKEAELHHVRIYPSEGGFHVQHYRRANDPSPERHTFNSAAALSKHIKEIASIPGREVRPKAEEVENKYGRAEGAE